MKNKNLRRISVLVTAQTAANLEKLAQMDGQPSIANLEKLAQMDGQPSIGRVMDKLVRDRMLSLRQPEALWKAHYLSRFGRCK